MVAGVRRGHSELVARRHPRLCRRPETSEIPDTKYAQHQNKLWNASSYIAHPPERGGNPNAVTSRNPLMRRCTPGYAIQIFRHRSRASKLSQLSSRNKYFRRDVFTSRRNCHVIPARSERVVDPAFTLQRRVQSKIEAGSCQIVATDSAPTPTRFCRKRIEHFNSRQP
jgi:hypothetical protein